MANSKAQIVATLGPASREKKVVRKMIDSGMDVVRLNFSWGTYDEHASYIKTVRAVAQEFGRTISIIQDLSGPRVEMGGGHYYDQTSSGALTEKDIEDLKFGIEQEVEYVALSYVGSVKDVIELKNLIRDLGGSQKIVAKIERDEALTNLDSIIEVSDAIMIARGDLGNEVPREDIPWLEKEIIDKCKEAKKPVITATQMLFSMTDNLEPTRAEVTDVFYAISLGSDAVMLSEETASGRYPVEAVQEMEKITLEAEQRSEVEINTL